MRWLLTVCLLSSSVAYGQMDMSLYDLNSAYQAGWLNPSFVPKQKRIIGAPFAGSTQYQFHSDHIKLSDVLSVNDQNQLEVNVRPLSDLDEEAALSGNFGYDWIQYGMRKGDRTFFRFGISEQVDAMGILGPGALDLIANGNASATSFDLGTTSATMIWYRKFSAGFNMAMNDKVKVGANAHYINGIGHISVQDNTLMLNSDTNLFAMHLTGNLSYTTSFLSELTASGSPSFLGSTPFFGKNHGFGADAGLSIDLGEKAQFAMSIINLGSIRWSSGVEQRSTNLDTASFVGFDLIELIDGESSLPDTGVANLFRDSLNNLLDWQTSSESISTSLRPRVYASYVRKFNDKLALNVMSAFQMHPGQFRYGFHLALPITFSEKLRISPSFNYFSNTANFGLSAQLDLGPVQAFFASDNVIGMFTPQHFRYASARGGILLAIN